MKAEALGELITQVRMLFRELRAATQAVHGDTEPTAGRRGVLTELLDEGPLTVPAMARRRNVSRQHVQVLVNSLLEDGLVTLESNPRHKRSRLVRITAEGMASVRSMLSREARLLRSFPVDATPTEVARASEVLRKTTEAFRSEAWRKTLTTDV